MRIINKINQKALLLMTLIALSGCGSEGDSIASSPAERALYANTAESMEPCKAIKEAQPELPLSEFVAGLEGLADQGEPCAQYGLGGLYIWGYEDIAADSAKAKSYLSAAADQGHELAITLLEYHF